MAINTTDLQNWILTSRRIAPNSLFGDSESDPWVGFVAFQVGQKLRDMVNSKGYPSVNNVINQINKLDEMVILVEEEKIDLQQFMDALDNCAVMKEHVNDGTASPSVWEHYMHEYYRAKNKLIDTQRRIGILREEFKIYWNIPAVQGMIRNEVFGIQTDFAENVTTLFENLITICENTITALGNSTYDNRTLEVISKYNGKAKIIREPIGTFRSVIIKNIEKIKSAATDVTVKSKNHIDNITKYENNEDVVLIDLADETLNEEVEGEKKTEPLKYTIASGDSLSKIAEKYGVDWEEIYEANRDTISNPNQIEVGQVIIIPGLASTVKGASNDLGNVTKTYIDAEKEEEIEPLVINKLASYEKLSKSSWSVEASSFEKTDINLPLNNAYRISSYIDSRWSEDGTGNGYFDHRGCDYVPEGSRENVSIKPIQEGVVVYSGHSNNGYGNEVVMLHEVINDDGTISYYMSRYAHLRETPKVKAGDVITDDSPIGIMGSTGRSSGTHLHLEYAKTDFTEEELAGKSADEIANYYQKKQGADTRLEKGSYINTGNIYAKANKAS